MICVAFVLMCGASLAEEKALLSELDWSGEAVLSEIGGFSFRGMIEALFRGESINPADFLKSMLRAAIDDFFPHVLSFMKEAAIPIIACLFLKIVLSGRQQVSHAANYCCRLAMLAVLARQFLILQAITGELIIKIVGATEAMVPILISALTLSGSHQSAIVMTPVSSLCTLIMQRILSGWGLALCAGGAVMGLAANLPSTIKMGRLSALIRQLHRWLIGLLMTGFMGYLTIQGKLASGRDSVAVRTARFAIESIVPVVGGSVSDSLETLLSTAGVLRGAVGATGMLVLLNMCLSPIFRLALMMFSFRLMAAIAEPTGNEAMVGMPEEIGKATEMLLVTSVAAMLLCVMLLGNCMVAANGSIQAG